MIGLCMYIYIFFREGRIIGRIRLGGAAYIQGLMFGGLSEGFFCLRLGGFKRVFLEGGFRSLWYSNK